MEILRILRQDKYCNPLLKNLPVKSTGTRYHNHLKPIIIVELKSIKTRVLRREKLCGCENPGSVKRYVWMDTQKKLKCQSAYSSPPYFFQQQQQHQYKW